MNKQELITAMAEKANIEKSAAEGALNAFIEVVISTVENGDKVQLPGFGGWEPSHRKARTGRDPKTGNPVQIPAKIVAKFKVGKNFKDAVNKVRG